MSLLDDNKLQIRMQLLSLLQKPEAEILKSHYKIFTIEDKSFVIAVTVIKTDRIWFETYFEKDGIKYDSRRHKIFGRQFTHVVDETLSRLSKSQIECAENILFRQCKKPKTIVKPEIEEEKAPVIRRRTKEEKQQQNQQVENNFTHLRTPKNEEERRKAEMERKLFNDPKMWEYAI